MRQFVTASRSSLRSLGISAALAMLALGACSGQRTASTPPCPSPAIVDGLDVMDQRGAAGGPTNVTWRAAMPGFTGGCRYDSDGVLLRYGLTIAVTPGPAFGTETRTVTLPYFVAVADPSGEIVDKNMFEAKFTVAPGTATATMTEQLEQRISGVRAGEGPGWRIFFGFQVPREQALERRREGR